MAARYIPPHLRSEYQRPDSKDPSTDAGTERFHSLREIEQYYWPSIEETTMNKTNDTLHASAQNPETLSYALLFQGAHPRWKDEGILFAKSNLNLLSVELNLLSVELAENLTSSSNNNGSRAQQEDSKPNGNGTPSKAAELGPVAVFCQTLNAHGAQQFKFDGEYRVVRVEFLAPHSPELERMLEQIWSLEKQDSQSQHKKIQYCNAKGENRIGSG